MDIIKIDSKRTRLISDGGCGYLEPDNSYAAFLASCNRMYYGIKCDIRFTIDRVIVTSRYRDLRKMANEKIHISLSKYEDLKKIRFGENDLSSVVSLKTFMSLCNRYHKFACLELHPPIGRLEIEQLINEIESLNMIKFTKIISNDMKYLKQIRKLNLHIKLEIRAKEYSDQLFFDAIKYHIDISLPVNKLSTDFIGLCHDNRIKCGTYNINDPVGALLLSDMQLDYIYTVGLEEYKPN